MHFETLETRHLLSTSTITTVSLSNKSALLGQPITITVDVKASKGSRVPTGRVELFDNSRDVGGGTVDKKGQFAATFDAKNALFLGTYKLFAKYRGTSKYAASRAKTVKLNITPPTFTTTSDGLKIATVTPGTGTAAVKAGDTVTFADTGFATDGTLAFESAVHGNGYATVKIGATPPQTVQASEEGSLGMKVGETRVLLAPPSLALNDGKTYYFIIQVKSIP